MVCINCGSPKTQVSNSRGNVQSLRTWRRRHCANCKTSFTTSERPDLESLYTVSTSQKSPVVPFSESLLAVSILEVMAYSKHTPETSFWLLKTVIDKVVQRHRPTEPLSTAAIAAIVHETLHA